MLSFEEGKVLVPHKTEDFIKSSRYKLLLFVALNFFRYIIITMTCRPAMLGDVYE
jgi:hypothetical protein